MADALLADIAAGKVADNDDGTPMLRRTDAENRGGRG